MSGPDPKDIDPDDIDPEGIDMDDIDMGEPIAELRELAVDGPDDFHDALRGRLARRDLGRQWIDGGIVMVGKTLLCYVMALIDVVFGRSDGSREKRD